MVEVVGNNIFLKEERIKDGKRSSMTVPPDDLVRNPVRNYLPDRFNELRYRIFSHFFDYLSKNLYSSFGLRMISMQVR